LHGNPRWRHGRKVPVPAPRHAHSPSRSGNSSYTMWAVLGHNGTHPIHAIQPVKPFANRQKSTAESNSPMTDIVDPHHVKKSPLLAISFSTIGLSQTSAALLHCLDMTEHQQYARVRHSRPEVIDMPHAPDPRGLHPRRPMMPLQHGEYPY